MDILKTTCVNHHMTHVSNSCDSSVMALISESWYWISQQCLKYYCTALCVGITWKASLIESHYYICELFIILISCLTRETKLFSFSQITVIIIMLEIWLNTSPSSAALIPAAFLCSSEINLFHSDVCPEVILGIARMSQNKAIITYIYVFRFKNKQFL